MVHESCPSSDTVVYGGAVPVLPARLQAENFDTVGSFDTTAGNEGGEYRSDVDVDIKSVADGYAVGWLEAGEYLQFTFNAPTAGQYQVVLRSGAAGAGRTLSITQCNQRLLDDIAVPHVEQWGEFKTWVAGSIELDAGIQKIQVLVGDNPPMDLDWLHIGNYSGDIDERYSTERIAWGTALNANTQVVESRALAQSLINPQSPSWRARGDQQRNYFFAAANASVPYRLYVPDSWDGSSPLPLVMFLHGAGADQNTYVDQNNQQMIRLAQQHGMILVSALGYNGAYGSVIRLPAVFGEQGEADRMIASATPERFRTEELSEKDVINVLELVRAEYPISQAFLTGHSMGSGGTWYIGGKYASLWSGLAPMSGPFVQEQGYPWQNLSHMPLLVTEGTGAIPSLAGSRTLRDWLVQRGFESSYIEVNADHGGMVPLVLPDVFEFFSQRVD